MKNKNISILLILSVLFTMIPIVAFAEESIEVQAASGSGTDSNPWLIGSNTASDIEARIDTDGNLSIGGNGAMQDFVQGEKPWAGRTVTNVNIIDIDVAKQITSIGANAFNGCTSLKIVHVPATVTSIGNNAFAGCINLKRVVMKSETPASSIGTGVFDASTKIIVPYSSVDAYKLAWSSYADNITYESDINVPLSITGGRVSVERIYAYPGETVILHVKANNNYELDAASLVVSYNDDGRKTLYPTYMQAGTGYYLGYDDYQFTMPSADVSVSATFTQNGEITPIKPDPTTLTDVVREFTFKALAKVLDIALPVHKAVIRINNAVTAINGKLGKIFRLIFRR